MDSSTQSLARVNVGRRNCPAANIKWMGMSERSWGLKVVGSKYVCTCLAPQVKVKVYKMREVPRGGASTRGRPLTAQ